MIYAVGLKGYVELRESPKPPVTKVTHAMREVEEKRCKWINDETSYNGGRYVNITEKVQRRLKNIVTTGGRFLTSMKARRFSEATRIHILPGGVWEVPPEHLPKLLGPLGRPRKEG